MERDPLPMFPSQLDGVCGGVHALDGEALGEPGGVRSGPAPHVQGHGGVVAPDHLVDKRLNDSTSGDEPPVSLLDGGVKLELGALHAGIVSGLASNDLLLEQLRTLRVRHRIEEDVRSSRS